MPRKGGVPRPKSAPPPRVFTLDDLCRDFRCTERERIELRVHLHLYRARKAMQELATHDALAVLR